jgi:hypothetical protein
VAGVFNGWPPESLISEWIGNFSSLY